MLSRRAGLSATTELSCCIYVSSFWIMWVASIVDLRVFWQPGSVTICVEFCDCCLFESNKYFFFFFFLGDAGIYTSLTYLLTYLITSVVTD